MATTLSKMIVSDNNKKRKTIEKEKADATTPPEKVTWIAPTSLEAIEKRIALLLDEIPSTEVTLPCPQVKPKHLISDV